MVRLKTKVAASLTSLLAKYSKQATEEDTKNDKKQEDAAPNDADTIAEVTVCKKKAVVRCVCDEEAV